MMLQDGGADRRRGGRLQGRAHQPVQVLRPRHPDGLQLQQRARLPRGLHQLRGLRRRDARLLQPALQVRDIVQIFFPCVTKYFPRGRSLTCADHEFVARNTRQWRGKLVGRGRHFRHLMAELETVGGAAD